jgi:hypothetical protein
MTKKTTVSVELDAEKYRAICYYAGKKNMDVQAELSGYLQRLYERHVPAGTREFIENAGEPEPKGEKPRLTRTDHSTTTVESVGGA